jgi:hypothetical protein
VRKWTLRNGVKLAICVAETEDAFFTGTKGQRVVAHLFAFEKFQW